MKLPAEVAELFDRPNFAHVATIRKDGGPHVVAVWACTVAEDRVAFFTQPGSLKARNLGRDGRVAMSIVDHDDPYLSATIQGHLAEIREGDAAIEVMDVMAVRHTGEPFPFRQGVLYVFEVDKAHFQKLGFERKTG